MTCNKGPSAKLNYYSNDDRTQQFSEQTQSRHEHSLYVHTCRMLHGPHTHTHIKACRPELAAAGSSKLVQTAEEAWQQTTLGTICTEIEYEIHKVSKAICHRCGVYLTLKTADIYWTPKKYISLYMIALSGGTLHNALGHEHFYPVHSHTVMNSLCLPCETGPINWTYMLKIPGNSRKSLSCRNIVKLFHPQTARSV